jgi:hypothetical protein
MMRQNPWLALGAGLLLWSCATEVRNTAPPPDPGIQRIELDDRFDEKLADYLFPKALDSVVVHFVTSEGGSVTDMYEVLRFTADGESSVVVVDRYVPAEHKASRMVGSPRKSDPPKEAFQWFLDRRGVWTNRATFVERKGPFEMAFATSDTFDSTLGTVDRYSQRQSTRAAWIQQLQYQGRTVSVAVLQHEVEAAIALPGQPIARKMVSATEVYVQNVGMISAQYRSNDVIIGTVERRGVITYSDLARIVINRGMQLIP